MSEDELLAEVIRLARMYGWRHYHTWSSKHSVAGFPDLVLVRKTSIIYAELKREGQHPTSAQMEWLGALAEAGAECYVWRPSDLAAAIPKRLALR